MLINYHDRFYKLKNEEGDEIVIDRFKPKTYIKHARQYLNYCRLNGIGFFKHFTLTQNVEHYRPGLLQPFVNALRMRYGRKKHDIVFFKVPEVQQKRLERTGEAVLHWHMIVGFKGFMDFDVVEMNAVRKFWKYGNFDVRSVPNSQMGIKYLMKYVTKSLNSPVLDEFPRLRRVSMSQIPMWYRQDWKVICELIERFKYDWSLITTRLKFDKRGVWFETGYRDPFHKLFREYLFRFPRWRLIGSYGWEAPF